MRTMLSAVAFVGAIGFAGVAQARDNDDAPKGRPPAGIMRSDIMMRAAAHDGRADTGRPEHHFRELPPMYRENQDHGFRHTGTMGLPIKSDVSQRVSAGDGRESSSKGASSKVELSNQQNVVKAYPGRHGTQPHLPIPLKMSVAIRLQGANANPDSHVYAADDPKLKRDADAGSQVSNSKVYPGRHEDKPSVVEMFMRVKKNHKHKDGDDPGAGN